MLNCDECKEFNGKQAENQMGRTYAGVLGLLAFCVVVTRGLFDGGNFEARLTLALFGLFGFAAIGFIVGSIASWTVHESVQARLRAQLEVLESPAGQTTGKT